MKPYYEDGSVTIYHGDCRDVLPTLEPVEVCITDPPYGLSFMGKGWDHGVPGVEFWRVISKALLPGAPLFAFGGTRTHHRLMCGIEDAGFDIRDCMMWLYGSGFPKSLDISKAIDKARYDGREIRQVTAWIASARSDARVTNADIDAAFGFNGMAGHWTTQGAQAAVPTIEQVPVLLGVLGVAPPDDVSRLLWELNGRKGEPGEAWSRRKFVRKAERGEVATRIYDNGEGPRLSQDVAITAPATEAAKLWHGWGTALKPAYEPIVLAMKPLSGTFAQNALEHGVAGLNIDGARIEHSGDADLARSLAKNPGRDDKVTSGTYGASRPQQSVNTSGRWPANVILDEDAARILDEQSGYTGFTDSGGASRFFYTAKASRSDRGEGNTHPTVKPSSLMRWLCMLANTPTGGTVLDPFMGSGTTLYAAKESGMKAIGIDLDERHCEIAANRCTQEVLAL